MSEPTYEPSEGKVALVTTPVRRNASTPGRMMIRCEAGVTPKCTRALYTNVQVISREDFIPVCQPCYAHMRKLQRMKEEEERRANALTPDLDPQKGYLSLLRDDEEMDKFGLRPTQHTPPTNLIVTDRRHRPDPAGGVGPVVGDSDVDREDH